MKLQKKEFFRVINQLKSLHERERFDILHTFFWDSIFVTALSKKLLFPKPVLLSSRRDMGLGEDELWYHKLFRLFLPVVNLAYDGIVVNSSNLVKWVHQKELVNYEKIRVIPNGIDIPKKKEAIPDFFLREKADIWIGIVANLKPIKRIDIFLKAFRQVKHECRDVTVKGVILGDGPLRRDLMSLAHKLEISSDVFFVGSVKNVISYLQNIDIGILCSDKEGLSNAILEYMACSLPVVATNVGGNSELVDNGINGFLVPPDNPIALANALFKLVESNELRKKNG